MSKISAIPDETVDLEKGYYHGVYVLLHLKKWYDTNKKYDHISTEVDPYQEDTEDMALDD